MNKLDCLLIIPPNASQHLSQIVTGFILLRNQGLIKLEVKLSTFALTSIVEVIINKQVKMAYDMADAYTIHLERVQDLYKRMDYIFKRSFKKECHINNNFAAIIHPLGLNYHVSMVNNPMDKPYNRNIVDKVKWYAKERLGRNYHQQFFVERFEDIPQMVNHIPRILFAARTWGLDEAADLSEEETRTINSVRAACIRKLRLTFGAHFVGGFSHRKEAVELYSDCLLDDSVTNRNNYLALMKSADICIATLGLHQSNGWKLGEYVAASKGIVAEKLFYDVPEFKANTNYVAFTDPDACVEAVSTLFTNKDVLFTMKKSNYEYYHHYLRPDKLVLNSLMTVIEK